MVKEIPRGNIACKIVTWGAENNSFKDRHDLTQIQYALTFVPCIFSHAVSLKGHLLISLVWDYTPSKSLTSVLFLKWQEEEKHGRPENKPSFPSAPRLPFRSIQLLLHSNRLKKIMLQNLASTEFIFFRIFNKRPPNVKIIIYFLYVCKFFPIAKIS